MQIRFTRSGGLAGMPGLNVEGTVDLGDQGAKVTSESSKYRRELAPPEVEQLRGAADPEGMSRARTALASRSTKVYDGYQYDITVATKDGKSHKLTFNAAGGGTELNQVAPGLGNLVQWIDNEAQKIKEHRLSNR
jgi:hypothetical protein